MQGFFHKSLFHLSAGNGFCLSIWLVTCSEGGWKGNLAWRNDVVSLAELSPQSWYFAFKPSLRQAERSLQIALSDGNTVADDGCGWTPPRPIPFKTGGFNLNHLMRKFTPGIMRTDTCIFEHLFKSQPNSLRSCPLSSVLSYPLAVNLLLLLPERYITVSSNWTEPLCLCCLVTHGWTLSSI